MFKVRYIVVFESMMKFVLLFAILSGCVVAITQQQALDKFAEQITKDRGGKCTAPQIGKSTSGSGCGTFDIEYSGSDVISVFVTPVTVCTNKSVVIYKKRE